MRRPAPRPCLSCPYRCDVPSGVWSADEYEKLPQYDAETYAQPHGMFQCHQNDGQDTQARMCAGWVACHGYELLSLRLAVSMGRADPDVMDYTTDVPIFTSGAEAAAHGMRDIKHPGAEALALVEKIANTREDVTYR